MDSICSVRTPPEPYLVVWVDLTAIGSPQGPRLPPPVMIGGDVDADLKHNVLTARTDRPGLVGLTHCDFDIRLRSASWNSDRRPSAICEQLPPEGRLRLRPQRERVLEFERGQGWEAVTTALGRAVEFDRFGHEDVAAILLAGGAAPPARLAPGVPLVLALLPEVPRRSPGTGKSHVAVALGHRVRFFRADNALGAMRERGVMAPLQWTLAVVGAGMGYLRCRDGRTVLRWRGELGIPPMPSR